MCNVCKEAVVIHEGNKLSPCLVKTKNKLNGANEVYCIHLKRKKKLLYFWINYLIIFLIHPKK